MPVYNQTCMSDFTYPDIYLLTSRNDPDVSIDSLRARVEECIVGASGVEELPHDLRERLDSELEWVERSDMLASWSALVRLVEVAREKRIPLGAALGSADGTLIGAALCSLPFAAVAMRPLEETSVTVLPPGVEAPGERREELLREIASEGSWVGWTPEGAVEAGQATLWLRPSSCLSLLDTSLRLATKHLSPDFAPETADPSEWPVLSDGAAALLKRGDVGGMTYLSATALKGWKGDASPESMGAIIARSVGSHDNTTKPPDSVAAWTEHTSDTGGALLYYDQFTRIVEATAGISPGGAAALRLAILNIQADLDGAVRVRFLAGCASSGLDEQRAGTLWDALAAIAPGLISRHAAFAWARLALWLANVKAAHPVAFIAASIDASWGRTGLAAIRPLVDNARRLGVTLLPPDVAQSHSGPTLAGANNGWAIRWGLAFLPGWDRHVAGRFVDTRARLGNCASLPDLAQITVEAGLSPTQVESLMRSGACDRLGGRDALMETLPPALEWARQNQLDKGGILEGTDTEIARASTEVARAGTEVTRAGTETCPYDVVAPEAPPGPRIRYARRTWEQQNLGVAFTDAHEIEDLRRAISQSGGLSERLTSSAGIGREQVGQSTCLVGLLHDVRLLPLQENGGASESKNGDKPEHSQQMAVAWVEDLDGVIELVAFPPNYKRHQELWAENNMVIITARVRSHSDGQGVYLLCEHLAAYHVETAAEEMNITIKPSRRASAPADTTPLPTPSAANTNGGSHKPDLITQSKSTIAEIQNPKSKTQNPAEPPAYQLIITLPTSEDDREDIDRMIALDRLFKAHQGPDTVTLRIPYSPETGAVTSAQLPRGVRYSSALEAKIRKLLGPDALALIKLTIDDRR